ncbi:MAG: DNA-binding protein WhiA [Lachnospiraceae bacterium]
MSFSSDVKKELAKNLPKARHCQIAEITAMISLCGKIRINEYDEYEIRIVTENELVANRFAHLIEQAFQSRPQLRVSRNVVQKRSRTLVVSIVNPQTAKRVLQATKLLNADGEIEEDVANLDSQVLRQSCCKRAYIRACFLSTGSMSNPESNYHFEIVCVDENKAKQIQNLLHSFDLDAKIVVRKKYFVVYIKEGALIVDVLNIMEAHVALMNMENVRIEKDVRNTINRRVNCELANITKTVNAASKQLDDIRYLQNSLGLGELSESLEQTARLRLEYPEASLKELGAMLDPPVGKSGVNHRLRKLSELAKDLRGC